MTVVYWQPIRRPCFGGAADEFAVLPQGQGGWVLLQQIRQMPRGKKVSLEAAWHILFAEIHRQMQDDNILGDEPGNATWLMENQIKWLTGQGYQILLRGDEFDFLEVA